MASRLDIPGGQHCGDKSNDRRLGSDVASDGRFPLWMVAIAPGGQGLSQTQRYPSRSQIFAVPGEATNFLSIPAYENKRCGCLVVYLEPFC